MGCGKACQKEISAEDYNLQIISFLCCWFLKCFACTFFVKMKWTDELEAALLQLWWKSEQETETKMVSKKLQYRVISKLEPFLKQEKAKHKALRDLKLLAVSTRQSEEKRKKRKSISSCTPNSARRSCLQVAARMTAIHHPIRWTALIGLS